MNYQLIIDTASWSGVKIMLESQNQTVEWFWFSNRQQSEQLLSGIVDLLASQNLAWSDLDSLKVVNQGGSFTSLRIGVVTANALAYALGLPIEGEVGQPLKMKAYQVIEPHYSAPPSISVKLTK